MTIEHVGQLPHDRPIESSAGQHDLHAPHRLLAHDLERRDLAHDEPARLLVALVLSTHEQHRVVDDEAAESRERLGEHHGLDLGGLVLEHEHGHAVALPGLERPEAGHDAGNRAVGVRLRQLAQPASAHRRDGFRIALQRMPRHVQPQRFLLGRERLGLGPGRTTGSAASSSARSPASASPPNRRDCP